MRPTRIPLAYKTFHFLCKHFMPAGTSTVVYDGFTLDIDRRAYPEMLFDRGITYQPIRTRVFKTSLQSGMTVLDIGAAMGYFTLAAAKEVGPTGHVFSFEPAPESFKYLSRNVERSKYRNITLINQAVSDKEGTAILHLSKDDPLAHSLGLGRAKMSKEIKVQTTSLDKFFRKTSIDVIKINVEGAEPLILQGMRNILKRKRPLVLLTEIDPTALKNLRFNVEDYVEVLQSHFTQIDLVVMKQDKIVPLERIGQILISLSRKDGTTHLLCRKG